MLEGGAAIGAAVYVAGVATVATIAAAANGDALGDAISAGADAARKGIGAIVAWASNKQQASHIKGKLANIEVHFGKLEGTGGPDAGDPDDPRNRKDWKNDIQRSIRQIRQHIEKITGDRNKVPWQKLVDEAAKRLTNTP